MKHEQLAKHFESMGARVKFRPVDQPLRSPRGGHQTPPSFTIDIQRDRQGEFFDILLGKDAPEFQLLQVKPKEQHLLFYTTDGQRFLCGHDERHWFVAGIGFSSTRRSRLRPLFNSSISRAGRAHIPGGAAVAQRHALQPRD